VQAPAVLAPVARGASACAARGRLALRALNETGFVTVTQMTGVFSWFAGDASPWLISKELQHFFVIWDRMEFVTRIQRANEEKFMAQGAEGGGRRWILVR